MVDVMVVESWESQKVHKEIQLGPSIKYSKESQEMPLSLMVLVHLVLRRNTSVL